jgi:hypothetical protein
VLLQHLGLACGAVRVRRIQDQVRRTETMLVDPRTDSSPASFTWVADVKAKRGNTPSHFLPAKIATVFARAFATRRVASDPMHVVSSFPDAIPEKQAAVSEACAFTTPAMVLLTAFTHACSPFDRGKWSTRR